MANRLDRAASRLSDWIQILVFSAGIIVAVVGGVFDAIQDFPIFWRLLFWFCFCGLMLSIASRIYLAIRVAQSRRKTMQSSDAGGTSRPSVSNTVAEIHGSRDISFDRSVMTLGGFSEAPYPVRQLDMTPATLIRLSTEMRELSQSLYQFHEERLSSEPEISVMSLPPPEALADAGITMEQFAAERSAGLRSGQQAKKTHDNETLALYQQRFEGRVAYLYHEARRRGYVTESAAQMEIEFRREPAEVAKWIGVFGERLQADALPDAATES